MLARKNKNSERQKGDVHMNENSRLEWLIESLIHVVGRAAVKVEEVCAIVGSGAKQIHAYNLCDGSLTLSEVAKKAKVDIGNFSRTVDRWFQNGVMFKFQEGREIRLLHIFPIPTKIKSMSKPKRGARR